jgi:hypothetical protein
MGSGSSVMGGGSTMMGGGSSIVVGQEVQRGDGGDELMWLDDDGTVFGGASIELIPLLGQISGSACQRIGLASTLTGTINDLKVELRQELGPTGLARKKYYGYLTFS